MLWVLIRGASNEHHKIYFHEGIKKSVSTFWMKKKVPNLELLKKFHKNVSF